jgi:hypothetical protein
MLQRKRIRAPLDARVCGPASQPEISAFWNWWKEACERVVVAIESGELGELSDEIGERVRAIHEELDWSLRPTSRPLTRSASRQTATSS